MNTCGTRITQFGFDKYIYDSLINQIAHPNMITQLGACDIDTLLYAAGHYNIRLLIAALLQAWGCNPRTAIAIAKKPSSGFEVFYTYFLSNS